MTVVDKRSVGLSKYCKARIGTLIVFSVEKEEDLTGGSKEGLFSAQNSLQSSRLLREKTTQQPKSPDANLGLDLSAKQ